MRVAIRYFAALREARGVDREDIETDSGTPGDIYRALAAEYRFRLMTDQIRFAVGGGYVDPDYSLQDGDELVLIPPVAGG